MKDASIGHRNCELTKRPLEIDQFEVFADQFVPFSNPKSSTLNPGFPQGFGTNVFRRICRWMIGCKLKDFSEVVPGWTRCRRKCRASITLGGMFCKIGKEAGSSDEGLIVCRRCGAKWRWRNRMSMWHTVCNPEMRTRRHGPDLRPKHRLTKKTDAATVLFRDPCDAVPPANVPQGDPPNHSLTSSSHPLRTGVG